ncbi:hypothetical protein IAQ61_000792 [Plenodomus lingam]|uniref:uncharacterized protein n=1 Tax=Leptosphaeria maculans TaxID=5022 RepID=UPI0033293551|nr:hypothetical protein IAQ61_000792 [Plenodomus lingam]
MSATAALRMDKEGNPESCSHQGAQQSTSACWMGNRHDKDDFTTRLTSLSLPCALNLHDVYVENESKPSVPASRCKGLDSSAGQSYSICLIAGKYPRTVMEMPC